MKKIITKLVRVLTVAPFAGLVLFTLLYALRPEFFSGPRDYILAIVFIVLLPLSAYPLQPVIPYFKRKGRQGQRDLAIITANIGYAIGVIAVLLFSSGEELLIVYLTYLVSGLLIVLFNKVLNIRASGHACGVAGPVATLVYFLGAWAALGLAILAGVYWASISMKRHTWSELAVGTVIPVLALLFSIIVVGLF